MRRITLFVLLCGIALSTPGFSQSPRYNFQYLERGVVNPAFLGTTEITKISLFFKNQYMNFGKGAPQTMSLCGNIPLEYYGTRHGLGIFLQNDKIGYFTQVNALAGYAYHLPLKNGFLSIAAYLGLINHNVNFGSDSWNYPEGSGSDPVVPTRTDNSSALDMGLGLAYYNSNLTAGLSVTHLNSPSPGQSSVKFNFEPEIMGNLSYKFEIESLSLGLEPEINLRSSIANTQIGLGTQCWLQEKYWGGLTYWTKDALALMGGLKIMDFAFLGVSYEYPLSGLAGTNTGSFEMYMSATFDVGLQKMKRKYISIRYL